MLSSRYSIYDLTIQPLRKFFTVIPLLKAEVM